jgi:hypothetical protein
MLPNRSYGGQDRRRHKMFVTKNTEYHFRDRVCVAVRDRRSGSWLPAHLALRRRLGGAVRFPPNGFPVPATGEPSPGEALFFDDDGRDLVTSTVCAIDRPPKELVESYPAPSCFVRHAD